jgi:AraC-like DNA-binding protein
VPANELADWVEHFWVEDWQFDSAAPQTRELLPHPNIQFVFAPNRSRIYGVQLTRFVRQLVGNSRILGIKFRPGAFYPFLRRPVSSLASTFLSASELFSDAKEVEEEVLTCPHDGDMLRVATNFLLAQLPRPDPHVGESRLAVEQIVNDRSVARVKHLGTRCGVQERTLQRLFHRYVGASPRWVIKRYRIFEALESIAAGTQVEWAALAQNLGYFDQAHFINDFRKLVGCSPSDYVEPLATPHQ